MRQHHSSFFMNFSAGVNSSGSTAFNYCRFLLDLEKLSQVSFNPGLLLQDVLKVEFLAQGHVRQIDRFSKTNSSGKQPVEKRRVLHTVLRERLENDNQVLESQSFRGMKTIKFYLHYVSSKFLFNKFRSKNLVAHRDNALLISWLFFDYFLYSDKLFA